jgi:DNA processing protein
MKLRKTSTPQRELEKLERLLVRVITWRDKTYPPLLREIDDASPVLYTYGQLTEADQFALAVLGHAIRPPMAAR